MVPIPDIRAVLFDIYGTLFISASGEVETTREAACESALSEALQACGVKPAAPLTQTVDAFFDGIQDRHAQGQIEGIEYPEVDIVEVWREVLDAAVREGVVRGALRSRSELERLAVEFEARANPVWPMPGLDDCLTRLRDRGLALGLISNAQFYTPELFPAFLGSRADEWGFEPDLQCYSYRHGHAKPGVALYRAAAEALRTRGIEASEAVYVGNDMLNDVTPASKVGFRTALFAGDARSLRLRSDDPRVDGVTPDVVLASLSELTRWIGS